MRFSDSDGDSGTSKGPEITDPMRPDCVEEQSRAARRGAARRGIVVVVFAFLVVIPALSVAEGEEPAVSRFSLMPPQNTEARSKQGAWLL